jgi:predicted O-linked N-acetylglucosamine transferase (SPINDLY family)
MDEALENYGKALQIDPNLTEALESRSNLLWTARRALAPAIADLERALAIAPDLPFARGDLLHLKMHAGDWLGFAEAKAELDQAVRAGGQAARPFVYQGLSDSASDMLACATTYAGRFFPALPSMLPAAPRRPGPIRVGYVCGEFRAQATMYLMAGLFESHDRSRFEILGFDNGHDDGSAMRARVVAGFDKFISIAPLSDRDAAAAVAAENIDILVNLNGYFGGMRMNLFAARPALTQVNYLGFPGTLGVDYMDYILADATVIPPGEHALYREKVVTLPDCYQVNDSKRAPPEKTSRAEHSLPEDAFVFCHFNYGYKITPDLFACWMRLLHQVPDSLLWLLAGDPLFQKNLTAEAAKAGIAPTRLVFAPPLSLAPHIARLALGDLFLDSLFSNAHTTASDALWAGLPLITRAGGAFQGRVAASLLRSIGLPEFVTESLAEYEALALKLARDRNLLKIYRQRLADNRTRAPLFDTARTTRHIEAAYEKMQALRLNGEAPQSFAVSSR